MADQLLIYRARLDQAGLNEMPKSERRLLVVLCHAANEVNAMHKLILWSSDFGSENEAVSKGQVALSLLLTKVLAGKLKEGWLLLTHHFFGTSISKEYEASLSRKAKQALAELKRYFGKRNTIDIIRSNYAFHYSADETDRALLSVEEDLDFYAHENGANTLYFFAELAANRALLDHLQLDDWMQAFEVLIGDVVRVGGLYLSVVEAILRELLTRHRSGVWQNGVEEIEIPTAPGFLDVRIPWFTDTSGVNPESNAEPAGSPDPVKTG